MFYDGYEEGLVLVEVSHVYIVGVLPPLCVDCFTKFLSEIGETFKTGRQDHVSRAGT